LRAQRFFAGRGNLAGSPRLSASQPRDDFLNISHRFIELMPQSYFSSHFICSCSWGENELASSTLIQVALLMSL
jgi:hypothetical protein